ncbi:FecR family protein [Draconibacterium halophilum]|uniref:FecR family protein n=1 Tax=Draconibacterium halophilum TaxID=2706887 RepID=A0A6C0RCF1_9BACT|nr:FecR domain-containing protein [Draconibacterium halophilum]QIA07425.1 FecR family protein [Draconibacterium halophilum]
MKEYYRKYIENNCTEEDFQQFVELFVKPDKKPVLDANMKEHWKFTKAEEAETPDLSDTLHKIHYEINSQEPRAGKTQKLVNYLARVAAVLFIPLAIAFFFTLDKTDISAELQTVSTPLASKTHFVLPDGSEVWLNSGSSLEYPKEFSRKKRLVKLSGEAYFDVQKSETPFEVVTENVQVNVLGTAFNVMSYSNTNPEVTLERGKVQLISNSGEEKILAPGQQAVIDAENSSIQVQKVDTEIYSSWIDNKLIFRNESLKDVVERLERWYNISIELDDQYISDKKLTATIEYESITEVMDLLEITMSLKYEYDKNERKLIVKPIK